MDNGTNVGIGTASPGAKLEVAGTALISGITTLSNLTASRLVTTDGSKNLTSTITAANLAASVSDITGVSGTGNLILGTSPSITSPALTGVPTAPTAVQGTNTTQLATTAFVRTEVDTGIAGLSWKNSARVATTANITLSGLQTIDGYTTIAGDRVLVKNQTTATQNGMYIAAAGAWSRSTDADSSNEFESMAAYISTGSTLRTT